MKQKNKKTTKILAVSDIHGDSSLAKKLAKKAEEENVDLVILAGDLTWLNQPIKNVIAPFSKLKKEILLIPGNHENLPTVNSLAEIYEGTKNLHGYSIKKGDLGIFGAGYDSSTGPFWVEDEEIFRTLQKSHEKIKDAKKKIMVTHAHPKGSKAEFSGFKGSMAVTKAIKKFKPDLVISGHIHEAGGIIEYLHGVRAINVARNAAIFEI